MPDVTDSDAELAELLAEVRRIEVQARRLASGALAGGYRSVFRGAGIEPDTVREYDPGDDPRLVDWNVTARMGRPFVKTMTDERDLAVVFVLDVSPSMGGGWGAYRARDSAARVVACLAMNAVRAGDRVGLVAFSRGVDAFVPPRRGPGHAMRIVRDGLVLRGEAGRGGLAEALDRVRRVVRRHAVVFVISDFQDEDWAAAMSLAARRHDVIAVRVIVPETDLPRAGLLRVRDPEGGRERLVDTSHAPTRRAWDERRRAWDARTTEALARAGVDRLDLLVPRLQQRDHVAQSLLAFFRMRELRGLKR
ncbi:MAG: DUF58 domain-containing protein [Planctomycetota bacterium]